MRPAAAALDRKDPDATKLCAMAKRFATDVGFKVANEALQLHGGAGYTADFPIERMLRDAKITQIYEGANEIQKLIIAKDVYARQEQAA